MNPVTPIRQLLAERAHVRGLALRLARHTADAEDLEQSAWLGALRHPPRHAAGLKSWFSTKLRYLAINESESRRRRMDREVFANEERHSPSPEDLAIQREVVMRIDSALNRLDERYSTVIRLRFYQGLSPHEIARRLDLPVETVRTRLRRGMMSMRSSLDGEFGDRQVWSTAILGVLSIWPAGKRVAKAGASTGGGLFVGKLVALLAVSVCVAAVCGTAVVGYRWASNEIDGSIGGHDVRVTQMDNDVSALVHPTADARIQVVPALSSPASGSLTVQASDAERGQPLAGLEIRVEPVERDRSDTPDVKVLTTAPDGRAHLEDVPPGTWEVIPERGDSRWVRVQSGRLSEIEFRIPLGERLSVVTETLEGEPLPGASVHVSRPGRADGWMCVGTSDDDGRIELRGIDPRSWIAGEGQAYRPTHARRASHPGEDGLMRLIFRPVSTLSGRVVDGLGRPIAGARLNFLPNVTSKVGYHLSGFNLQGWKPVRTVTDAEGRWDLFGVMDRPQDLAVTAAGYRSRVERISPAIAGGEPMELVLEELAGTEPRVELLGTVVDEYGAPFSGAIVLARETGGVPRSPMLAFAGLDEYWRTATDGLGHFRIPVDHRGPHDLYVLGLDGREDYPLACSPGVEPGEPISLGSSAVPSGVLTGQFALRGHATTQLILDAMTLAVPRLIDPDPATGRFHSDGLPAGEYRVYAVAHGRLHLLSDAIPLLADERRDVGLLSAPALGELRVIVHPEDGVDISKVVAEVYSDFGRERRIVGGGEGVDGSFAIDGTLRLPRLSAGIQRVVFRGGEAAETWVSVEISEGRESRIDVTLTRGIALPFEVRSLGGCIGSVIVEAIDSSGVARARRCMQTRAPSAKYRFHLAPGPYRMRVTRGVETIAELPVDVNAGESPRLLLLFE